GVSGWGGRAHSVGSIPRPLLRAVERREATATQTDRIAHSLVSVCVLERVPWTLDGVPRRALPTGTGRARRRMLHSGRGEGRALAPLVIPGQLKVVALPSHTDGDVSDPGP